jgi:hypothetical protein
MVRKFTVITNHKNLEYFTTRQLLLERHVRWADTLSMYNLTFVYRPGKINGRADAMSRKEEDTPAGEDDDQMMSREFQMLCLVTKQEFTKHEREAGALLPPWLESPFPAPCTSQTGLLALSVGQQVAQQRDQLEPETKPRRTLASGYNPEQ